MKIQMGVTQKMKLYNVYHLCKKYAEFVCDIKLAEEASRYLEHERIYKISKWTETKNVLGILAEIPALSKTADDCINAVPVFKEPRDTIQLDTEAASKFEKNRSILANKMQVIIDFYESMNIADPNENGIDVKLPPCETLKDYIGYLKEIDFIFSQCPFLQCENEILKFESVDVGSNWIKLAVAATSTCIMLKNIGALIDTAFALRSHYITIQQQQETLKAVQMKNELADEEMKLFTSLKNAYLSKAVSQLEEKCGGLKDGEEKGKAEKTLKKLCVLIDKGVEIYASIDAPEDVQLLFPEIQGNLELPGELMQYLEDKEFNEVSENPN